MKYSLSNPPISEPRVSVGARHTNGLGFEIIFGYERGGHTEVLSLAEAAYLAERLTEIVERAYFRRAFDRPANQ